MNGMSRHRNNHAEGAITGTLRVGGDPRALAARTRKGDIVVIDRVDVDAATADLIADKAPAAVINASPSLTGRFEARGATRFEERGVALFDAMDRKLLAVDDASPARLVFGSDTAPATLIVDSLSIDLHEVGAEHIAQRLAESAHTGALRLPVLAASALDLVQRDGPSLVDGAHVPDLDVDLTGKDVLVVAAGAGYKEQLRHVKSAVKELKMVVIATGDAADAAATARQPHIVVGPFDSASDDVLRSATVAVAHGESHAVAATRAGALGVRLATSQSRLEAADLAIALAASAGARTIVVAGMDTTVPDLIDSPKGASSLLARMAAGPAWIDARTFARVYRSRASRALSWVWVVVAGLALAGAASLHPSVRDFVTDLVAR